MELSKEELRELIKEPDINKPYAFVSYKSKDWKKVYPFVIDLQKKGVNIWIDKELIKSGARDWQEPAFKAIRDNSCKLILFFMSENSITSAPVCTELNYSTEEEVKIRHSERALGIIPINIDEELTTKHGSRMGEWIHKYIVKKYDGDELTKEDIEVLNGNIKDFDIKKFKTLFNIAYYIFDNIFQKSSKFTLLENVDGVMQTLKHPFDSSEIEWKDVICLEHEESTEVAVEKAFVNTVGKCNIEPEPIIDVVSPIDDKNHGQIDFTKEVEIDWVNWKGKLPKVIDYSFRVDFLGRSELGCKIWKDVYKKVIELIGVDSNLKDKFLELREEVISYEDKHTLKTFFTGQSSNEKAFTNSYKVNSMGIEVETYWNQENLCKEIKKLFNLLEIDFNDLHVYGKLVVEDAKEADVKICDYKAEEIRPSAGEIEYKFNGNVLKENQSEFMFRVFEEVVKRHPDCIEALEKTLTSVSFVDYENKTNRNEKMPSYFRGCHTFTVGDRKVCIGSSYGFKDKLTQVYKMINICGENTDILEVAADVSVSRNTGRKISGGVDFTCFGKTYNGYNYADFMAEFIKQLFIEYPDKVKCALGNVVSDKDEQPANFFMSAKKIEVSGKTYIIGTHSSTKVKLGQILTLLNKMNINPSEEVLLINGRLLSEVLAGNN